MINAKEKRISDTTSVINVLMYHSISDGPGPTCISPKAFREQMQTIDRQGYRVVALADFIAWRNRERELPSRTVVITFDDGFADFANVAFSELNTRGWPATVFLPTSLIGAEEHWEGQLRSPRRLMTWSQISRLAGEGIDFGAHTMTHPDLTRLNFEQARQEIRGPREVIQHRIGVSPVGFAPPYGCSSSSVRNEIRKWYQVSVGVGLHRADRKCDLFDVPRLEMHYFRNIRLWDAFLAGRADSYLTARRIARRLRRIV